MSEPFGFWVDYHTPFGRESVSVIAEAVSRAVSENWAKYQDRLSDSAPRFPVVIEEWLTQAEPGKLRGLLGSPEPPLYSDYIGFNYSPLSAKVAGINLAKREDGTISAGFLIAESARYERPGLREELRPESERQKRPTDAPEPWDDNYEEWEETWYAPYNIDLWPINKQCILHILENLKDALPVKRVSIDEILLE